MLADKDALATIAVKDIGRAREFYEHTLGLKQMPSGESGVLMYTSGKSTVLVYESQFAGTNRATSATWIVGNDVHSIAAKLKAKGVRFEHYDFPGTTLEGDVHVSGKIQVAWFRDPDDNILSIVNG